jgi:hypothetical protein
MPEKKDFATFCSDQVKRLSQFKAFGFMEPAALKDYRRWLERKCGTKDRAVAVMDIAIECDEMPTLSHLNVIFSDLYVEPFREPEISLEERKARALHLRDWYAKEAIEAERRRSEQRLKSMHVLPEIKTPVTVADFKAVISSKPEQGAAK